MIVVRRNLLKNRDLGRRCRPGHEEILGEAAIVRPIGASTGGLDKPLAPAAHNGPTSGVNQALALAVER